MRVLPVFGFCALLLFVSADEDSSDKCTNSEQESLEWKGTQKTFIQFRNLPALEKSRLRAFELSDTEDLDIDDLLEELRLCSDLEFLRLHNVELIGQFPNSTSRILLPKLVQFDLKLTYAPYPPQSLGCADYFFFTKSATDALDILAGDVDFKIEVGGYTLCKLYKTSGEFLMGYNDSALVSSFLTRQGSRSPKVKKLTLKSTDVDIALIPEDLSYLQLSFAQVGNGTAEAYNEVVRKCKRLRSLHLEGNYWEIQDVPFDLSLVPRSLESLSLKNFRLGFSRMFRSFHNAVNVYFRDCVFDFTFFELTNYTFPSVEKFGITFAQDENSKSCPALLNTMLFSEMYTSYDSLDFIFIENCFRAITPKEDVAFDKIVNFLEHVGVTQNVTTFVLEKKGNWIGREITAVETKRIIYDFQKFDKLESWTVFKNI